MRAQSAGPFAGLSGSWTGGGSIRLSSGAVERLTCRANYVPGGGGDTLEQNLRCASQSYNFKLQIDLANNGGAILGSWNELTRRVQGGISGHGSKGLIQATVRGQAFSADVTVVTRGAQQSVNIRAPSGDLAMVSIDLHRGR
ncbi:MAG: hypothetical protein ABR878_15585 [Roseiarcus sp.]